MLVQQSIDYVREGIDKWNLDTDQVKVMSWLASSDPPTDQNTALKQRHNGTGLWFIRGEEQVLYHFFGSMEYLVAARLF
jgi:hypothetical protein